MISAGKRDQLITIERATAGEDAYGEETLTWAEFTKEWSAVFWGRGNERREAAREQGQQPATFQVLANLDTLAVTIEDRINLDGEIFDIAGIAPVGRGVIEFTGVRAL